MAGQMWMNTLIVSVACAIQKFVPFSKCYRQKRFTGKAINVVKHQTRSNTFKSLFQQPLSPPTPLQAPNHARGYKQRAEIICSVYISPYHTQAMKIAGSAPPNGYQKKKINK